MKVFVDMVVTFATTYYIFGAIFGIGMLAHGAGIVVALEMLLAWPLHLVLVHYGAAYDWFATMGERMDWIREERRIRKSLRDIERNLGPIRKDRRE